MRLLPSQKLRQDYKQMRQLSSQANPSPLANHDRRARSSRKHPNPPRLTSPPGHTRISIMVITNVPFALKTSQGVHGGYGRAEHAGPCSTWAASRSGQQMRVRLQRDSRLKMGRRLLRGSGAAPAATYQRTLYPRTSTVGARRSWIRAQHPVYHHSRVARLAHDPDFSPSPVHTLAARRVMPAPVLRVA